MRFRRFSCAVTVAISLAATSVVHAQTVAQIDTGSNAQVNIVFGFDFFSNSPDAFDGTANQHGTTSSLIIDSMSPGIPIGNYKVTDGSFNTTQAATDAALLSAAANPEVRTIALSQGAAGLSSTIGDASGADKLIAVRAGNENQENPNVISTASFNLPGVVIVGATDGAGGLLVSSNRAGVTAERYVATPGVSSFSSFFGTSFAAARLAGIAAEVHRQFPFLTGEELAQVIFATALDFGEPGTDPIYGRGVVFDAAQVINSPAGPTRIATGGGGGAGVGMAALLLGGAAAAALMLKKDKELKTTLVLDSFGRPFYIDLTRAARVEDRRPKISNVLARIDERFGARRLSPWQGAKLDIYYTTLGTQLVDIQRHLAFSDDSAWSDQPLNWSMSLRHETEDGFNYRVDANTDPRYNFGAVRSLNHSPDELPVSFLSGQAFSTPFLSFSGSGHSVQFGYRNRGGFAVDFGLVSTDEGGEYGEQSAAAIFEGSYEFEDRGTLSVQLGRMEETGSLFGGSSGGAFGVRDNATYSLSLSGSWNVSRDVSLIGNYGTAFSTVDDARYSLLHDFSSVRSNWYGLGLVANHVLRRNDQFGVAFSQPLRVAAGDVDMHIPYARDFEGNILKSVSRIGLEPGGREQTLEAYYRMRLGANAMLGAYLMLQNEPNHFKNAGAQATFLTTLKVRF